MTAPKTLTLTRPDDWHLHLRDDDIMAAVLPYSAKLFGRAIIMPNLVPPVTTQAAAQAYRERILKALPSGVRFEPLMTCYLTDSTDPDDLIAGFKSGIFTAAKLYPAGATTNSDQGVSDISKISPTLEAMANSGMPLLVHGEVVDNDIDIFDREAVFIERVLDPVRRQFPGLKIVFEHITTNEAVDYVLEARLGLAATITPHHLVINRNALLVGGIRPHLYCLPVAKRERHRVSLVKAAISGNERFFLGTDSAPHLQSAKETACGCAGIFNAPTTLPYLAQIFEQQGALDKLEAFASLNGAGFYGLAPNGDKITLERHEDDVTGGAPAEITIGTGKDKITVFHIEGGTPWQFAQGAGAEA